MLLRKKFFLILVIFILLFSTITIAQMCQVAQARNTLRKVLFDYLTDPSAAQMALPKIKDLLNIYLSISEGEVTLNCTKVGAYSGEVYEEIINEADRIITTLPTCADGTQYGECSLNKPKYCHAEKLIDKCKTCGCPENQVCKGQKCIGTTEKIACNVNADCGINDYIENYFCQNNDVYRNYKVYFCSNPGTHKSYCSDLIDAILIDDCVDNEICLDGLENCKIICYDADLDGSEDFQCGGTDCDDTNNLIYPGANEICNGVDDDCDRLIDEDNVCAPKTIYLQNLGDAYVHVRYGGVYGNTNNGDGIPLHTRNQKYDTYRSYLKFDLSQIPANVEIQQAKFSLYRFKSQQLDPVSVYHVLDNSWNEYTITWNNQPCGFWFDNANNCNLNAIDTNYNLGENMWVDWDVTSLIQQLYLENKQIVSLIINTPQQNSNHLSNYYYSKEYENEALHPKLEIKYTSFN